MCLAITSFAQSTFLDTSFADNGSAVFSLSANNHFCRFQHVGLQSDGKIVAVGWGNAAGGSRAVAARFHSDGSLDTSFGNGGQWISSDIDFPLAYEVLIQPDDKILITGWGSDIAKAVRLTSDGVYDSSFGIGGKSDFAIWPPGGPSIMIDMVLQPDGKILVGGYNTSGSALVRLNTNGFLDLTFGTAGKIIINPTFFSPQANDVYGLKLDINSSSSILISGIYNDMNKPRVGFVMRYNSNGQLDTTFGENGIARFYYLEQQIQDLFVLPTQELLVLCDIYTTPPIIPRTTLVKWLPNGQIDTSFANKGYAQLPFGPEGTICRNGFLQQDGKVIAFGVSFYGTAAKGMMVRFAQNGAVDSTLGINGVIVGEAFDAFDDGLVQPDGKILSVAPYKAPNGYEYGNIRRYLGSNFVGTIETTSAISSALIYPNPVVTQSLNLVYELPRASSVKIKLMDIQGNILNELLNDQRSAGKNEEIITIPADLRNGFYLLDIQTDNGNVVVKVLVRRP